MNLATVSIHTQGPLPARLHTKLQEKGLSAEYVCQDNLADYIG